MKQSISISSLVALVGLAASAVLSTGCASLPAPPDFNTKGSSLSLELTFVDSTGAAIPSGTAVITGTFSCNNIVINLADLFAGSSAGGNNVSFTQGWWAQTLSLASAPAPLNTFDSGNCQNLHCAADVTDQTGTLYPAVAGTCQIAKSTTDTDGNKIGLVTGRFQLPAPAASTAPAAGAGTATIEQFLRRPARTVEPRGLYQRYFKGLPFDGDENSTPSNGGSHSAGA